MTELLLHSLLEKITFLDPLVQSFKSATLQEKISLLNQKGFFVSEEVSKEREYLILCLKCIGQWNLIPFTEEIVQDLLVIDQFYKSIGGIIGYHQMVLSHLKEGKKQGDYTYYPPKTLNLCEFEKGVKKLVLCAIKNLPLMCEIYPLGGAADRLHLVDEKTNLPLPAAKLPFLGKGLLRLLIEDVQAREYLYFKIFKKRCLTPICMMTSKEKNNHEHVLKILEKNQWFHRDKNSFFLFSQPSVPTLDAQGNWCLENEKTFKKKPGGHGVLWKMLLEKNLFPVLKTLGRKKALIRQINNPISGVDYGLLAFMGYGIKNDSEFGFIGCDPLTGTKEGINVLVEKKEKKGFSYFLSNIEYCDQNISSMNEKNHFLSNTNILFCDLEKIKHAAENQPFPGSLINFKEGPCFENNTYVQKKVARLEATMQNISDEFSFSSPTKLLDPPLNTFVAHAERSKTISPAKKAYKKEAFIETPEKAFYDLLKNAHSLLTTHCDFTLPDMFAGNETSFKKPAFIFFYHAALGPLYSIISQKLKGGSLSLFSEVVLEIAELSWENVHVNGSFRILSASILGHKEEGKWVYSELGSKVFLKNINIKNQGVDYENTKDYWRNKFERKESCTISLGKNSEFHAEDVTLEGDKHFIIEENMRLILKEENGKLVEIKEEIEIPTWSWMYSVNSQFDILLEKKGV